MLFNSIDFMLFFPIVCMILFLLPKKARTLWLLICSYYFYMGWNPKYALLIALSTLITYASGILIAKSRERGKCLQMKLWVWGSLLSNLGILAFFKYASFVTENLSHLTSVLGLGTIDRRLDLLLPVGISFYTFQALSYTIDVYRGKIGAEKNLIRYALFVSFFPQLVAGPIERSENLLTQVQHIPEQNLWNFNRVRDGFFLMMWGLFQKMVIADRAALYVDPILHNYERYGFLELTMAAALFAVQIYCDFGGYTNIARGAARVMGFELMNNFRQPYLARNFKDFWRRWHISLTSWFTDYLYIPLGGNRKGTLRKYLNILIVFAVSGLWHGAEWHFVVWGVVHAILQIVEDIRKRFLQQRGKYREKTSGPIKTLLSIGVTYTFVTYAYVFFVADDMGHAWHVFRQMFRGFWIDGFLQGGLDVSNWMILFAAILILLVVDVLHERGISIYRLVNRQNIILRWAICVGLIWTIILFGIYGTAYDASAFIYFQF